MTYNHDLHPKHAYRNLDPYVAPRVRATDIPNIDAFDWHRSEKDKKIWCTDKVTGQTLFVCEPPKTMREALIIGYICGKSAGYKSYDYSGEDLIRDLYQEDIAHYQVHGYYPDEVPPAPPVESIDDYRHTIHPDDLPKQKKNKPKTKYSKAS